ncbi:MAG TPA: hypothetical protein VND19_17110 [Acetobacteraceae bacterium]|nr:hypothetical protein [Acetobacteraceae bacterium]
MDESKDLFGALTATALRDGSLNGARAMLAMEGAALAAMTPLAHGWLRRREESLTAARRLLDSLGAATDPMGAIQAQQLWWTGATERLTEDAGAWAQFGMALLRMSDTGVPPTGQVVPVPRSRTAEIAAA